MVGTGSHIGRPFSKVWSYFTEVILEESGEGPEKKEKKKQKCNHCENLVSSKATRLRDHLIKCQGIFMNEAEPPEVVLQDSGNLEAVTPVAAAVTTTNIGDGDIEDDQGPSMDNPDDSFEPCPRPKVSSKSSAKNQAETMLIGQMYKKMTALETKVNRLETELRHVRKKMLLYETNCVTNIINQFKEQKFSVTLNPIADHAGMNESGNDLNNDYAPQIPTRNRNRKFGSTPVLVTNDQDSGSGSNTSGTHSDSYQNNSSLLPDISSTRQTPTKRKRPRTTTKRPSRAKSPKDGPPAKGGRRTDTIWDHFNISNDVNGKRITFCKICESLVSARAPRLRSHLEICSSFNSDNPVNIKRETEFYIQDEDDQEDDSFQDENELMDTVAPDRNVTTDGNITLVLDDN